MYEQGQESSALDKLLVYAGMTNICSQFSGIDDGSSAAHNHNLVKVFSGLLLQVLDTFPMMTPPTTGTVEALLLAVSLNFEPHSNTRLTLIFTGTGVGNRWHVQAIAVMVTVLHRRPDVSSAWLQPLRSSRSEPGPLVPSQSK
jgi:hypothetical protein